MTATYRGDTCGCGQFRYAGHRCTWLPAQPTELDRLRAESVHADRAFDRLRGDLFPWQENPIVARALDAERRRIKARIAELEGVHQ